jgi:hypothetical protein
MNWYALTKGWIQKPRTNNWLGNHHGINKKVPSISRLWAGEWRLQPIRLCTQCLLLSHHSSRNLSDTSNIKHAFTPMAGPFTPSQYLTMLRFLHAGVTWHTLCYVRVLTDKQGPRALKSGILNLGKNLHAQLITTSPGAQSAALSGSQQDLVWEKSFVMELGWATLCFYVVAI